MRRIAPVVLAALTALAPVRSEILPDDHGNRAETATLLSGPSNTVSGVIDYDTDTDVFAFSFAPEFSYIIQVVTGTIDDVELRVTPPSSATILETNTVRESPAGISWTNGGAMATWQLSVAGMFAYTTGSYEIAVWESPLDQDLDGDGMADSWEVAVLGSVTNNPHDDKDGDTQSNLEEYYAQTDGGNASSLVKVDDIQAAGGDDVVNWQQAAFSVYRIDSSTDLLGPWSYTADSAAGDVGGLISWTNVGGGSDRMFYRVRFVY